MSCNLRKYKNFGLDLHPSGPKPVNFFGAQSSLGGGTIFVWEGTRSHLGGTAPVCSPWRRVCIDANSFDDEGLKKLFIQYNTTLPSSAAVERLFSLGKDILKPKRCRLSDEHFEMLAFLKGN